MWLKENWRNLDEKSLKEIGDYFSSHDFSVVDGGILDDFEQRMADFFGRKYCVSFCNGTAAIHAATYAVFGSNSCVNVPKYSYFGAVNALLENRSHIHILDVDNESLLFDLDKDRETVGEGHLFLTSIWGASYSPDELTDYKRRHPKARIVMDNSHAYGTLFNQRNIASYDVIDVCCYSMGRGKFVDAGELGIAVTNDLALAKAMMSMGHPHRVSKNRLFLRGEVLRNEIGNKYRPHVAALLLAMRQIDRLPEKLESNRRFCASIVKQLSCVDGISCQSQADGISRCYWKIPFRVDFNTVRATSSQLRTIIRSYNLPLLDDFQYSDCLNYATWTDDRYCGQVDWEPGIPKSNYENWLLFPGIVNVSDTDIASFVSMMTVIFSSIN